MIDWLLTPLSGSTFHLISPWTAWHARCMVLGWTVLLPLGALAARYFKVLPWQDWPHQLDHKAWWHGHRALQWSGVAAMTLGTALAAGHGNRTHAAATAHALLGWALVAAGWLQIASGWLRGSKGGPGQPQMRGDHYDMTPRRIAFERVHKGLGWLAVCGSVPCVALGLVVADAPRWMAVGLAGWLLLLGLLAASLQRRGRCIDTYQAIWGPDSRHPGNRRAPIGIGVNRP